MRPACCGPSQNYWPHTPRLPLVGAIQWNPTASMASASCWSPPAPGRSRRRLPGHSAQPPRRAHPVPRSPRRSSQDVGAGAGWGPARAGATGRARRAARPGPVETVRPLWPGSGPVRAHGVVLDAPDAHRGMRGGQTVERVVRSSSSPWIIWCQRSTFSSSWETGFARLPPRRTPRPSLVRFRPQQRHHRIRQAVQQVNGRLLTDGTKTEDSDNTIRLPKITRRTSSTSRPTNRRTRPKPASCGPSITRLPPHHGEPPAPSEDTTACCPADRPTRRPRRHFGDLRTHNVDAVREALDSIEWDDR